MAARVRILSALCIASALIALATLGCGKGTEWEHAAIDGAIRSIDTAKSNDDELVRLLDEANDQAIFDSIEDISDDLDAWLERNPNATPDQIRAFVADSVALHAATLANRLAAAERLRDQRDTARENLDAVDAILTQLQAVNQAQMAFGERWRTATTQIRTAAQGALARRAENKAKERAEKKEIGRAHV